MTCPRCGGRVALLDHDYWGEDSGCLACGWRETVALVTPLPDPGRRGHYGLAARPCEACREEYLPRAKRQRFCGVACASRWVNQHRAGISPNRAPMTVRTR